MIAEFWNAQDITRLEEFFHPDLVNHNPISPDVRTRDEFREWVKGVLTGMPFHLTIGVVLVEGDWAAHSWFLTGKHTAPFLGIPPTGREFTYTGNNIVRMKDGKMVEAWWAADALGLMIQLGVIPAPQGA